MLFPPPVSCRWGDVQTEVRSGYRLVSPGFSVLDPGTVESLRLSDDGLPVEFHGADVSEEGYELRIQPGGIRVGSSDERGALNALRTLAMLPEGGACYAEHIEDRPALELRIFHLDLKDQMLSFDYILRLIDRLATFRYNALLVEYEDKFPYSEAVIPPHPERLDPDKIKRLIHHCRIRGIEVIPKVPTLGHLEFVLYHHPELAETEARYQVCPLNENALPFITRMLDEVIELHPNSRFLHVGGDETWHLGQCPRCSGTASQDGLADLYGRFMREILRHVLKRGPRPLLWADMVLGHPDALQYIDRETIMVDWQYSYYGEEVDYIVAWGEGGSAPSERWGDLPQHFRRRYGDFLRVADSSPWAEGFPYTEFLREEGYDVITAPAVRSHGDPYTHPNWKRHLPNVFASARVASEDGALGVLVTSWAVRRVLPPLTLLGAAGGGWAAWRPEAADAEGLLVFPDLYGAAFLHSPQAGRAMWEMSFPGIGFDQAVPRDRSADALYFANPSWQERLQRGVPDWPELNASSVNALSERIAAADRSMSVLEWAKEGSENEEIVLWRLAAEEMLVNSWALRIGSRLRSRPDDGDARKMAEHVREQAQNLKDRCAKAWAAVLHPDSLRREIDWRFTDIDAILSP